MRNHLSKIKSFFTSTFSGKIVLAILIPFVVLMTISISYVMTTLQGILQDTFETDIDRFVLQVNENFNKQLNTLYNLNMLLVSDKDLTYQMSQPAPAPGSYEAATQRIELEEMLENSSIVTTYSLATADNSALLERIYLFRDETTFFKAIFRNRGAFENQYDTLFKEIYLSRKTGNLNGNIGIVHGVLWYAFDFTDPDTDTTIGTLLYQVNMETLKKIPNSILDYQGALWQISLDDHTVLLSSNDSDIPYFSASNGFSVQKIKGESYLASHYHIPQFGLTLSLLVPQTQSQQAAQSSTLAYVGILLLMAVCVLVFSMLLLSRVMTPFTDLTRGIRQIEQGDLQAKLPVYRDAEFNELSHVFNSMTSQIDHLVNDVYQKQLLITQSELRALQSQMNPHFIFNVLNTISIQAQMNGDEKVSQMVYSLSQLMQDSIIKKGEEKVTIARELEYAQFYVSLQNERFDGKIQYQVNCSDPSLLECYIPKLTLQPLIENAVVHGLEPKYGNGRLAVNIYHAGTSIYIDVIDDGVGFSPQQIDLELADSQEQTLPGHRKIGLANSHKIIRHFYGIGYGLSIVSSPGNGCRVTLHIPLEKQAQSGGDRDV